MNENLSVFLAFGAGLMSFLSPCVLPLIPSWLCVIGGSPRLPQSSGEDSGEKVLRAETERSERGTATPAANSLNTVTRTVSFVLGFSVVFTVLSIVFSATFLFVGGVFRYINIAAGLIVIILGLNIIFDFLSFLNYEKRFSIKKKSRGLVGAFLAGIAFGAGWTPCIGPVLTSILILAAQSGGIPRAAIYLAFFSAGLGLPFILASLFFDVFLRFSVKLRKYTPLIQRICGILLIAIGVLIITGYYQELSALAAALQRR